jgi:hypothetical protein
MSQKLEGTLVSVADPQIDQIVKRVTQTARLAVHKAAAHAADPGRYPISSDPDSLERKMLARLLARKPRSQARAATRIHSLLAAPAAERTRGLGALAAVDLRSTASVAEQVATIAAPAALRADRARLERLIADPALLLDGTPGLAAAAASAPKPSPPPKPGDKQLDRLELRIRKVKVADETDGFMWTESGDDEVSLGGTAMDESGELSVIKPFLVGKDMEDNDERSFGPDGRTFVRFDLHEGKTWPKTYYVSLIFSEGDNGGFPEFLRGILLQLKGMIAPMLGSLIGAGIGTLIPIPGLGTLLGAAVGALLGSLVQALVDIWEDDVFPVVTPWAAIKSFDHRFASSGTHTSDTLHVAMGAHGGRYECWYDWRVFAG